jgi:hypothetical protein
MTALSLKSVIEQNLKGLSDEALREIVNFVLFVRIRQNNENSLNEQDLSKMLFAELSALNITETTHLEAEFENYQNKYPLEKIRH